MRRCGSNGNWPGPWLRIAARSLTSPSARTSADRTAPLALRHRTDDNLENGVAVRPKYPRGFPKAHPPPPVTQVRCTLAYISTRYTLCNFHGLSLSHLKGIDGPVFDSPFPAVEPLTKYTIALSLTRFSSLSCDGLTPVCAVEPNLEHAYVSSL